MIFEFKISPSWIISTSKHWCLFWSWDRRQSFYGIKLCQVLLFGWIITILHFSRFTTIFAPKHFSNANPNTFAHNKPKSMKPNKINFQEIPKMKEFWTIVIFRQSTCNFDYLISSNDCLWFTNNLGICNLQFKNHSWFLNTLYFHSGTVHWKTISYEVWMLL